MEQAISWSLTGGAMCKGVRISQFSEAHHVPWSNRLVADKGHFVLVEFHFLIRLLHFLIFLLK